MFGLLTKLLRRGQATTPAPDAEAEQEAPASPPPAIAIAEDEVPLPAADVVQLAPPDNRYHRIHPQTLALVEEMRSYAGFVEIMQAHITNVCSDTQDAAQDILGQALDIETSVSDLVRHVGQSMQSDQLLDATESLNASVQAGRDIITQLVHQHATTQQEIRESLEEVRALSDRMRAHLHEIEDVRRYTDLLAINARIRIASLGSNTGLDVIAEEIRALATQTGRLAHDLNVELGEMDHLIAGDLMTKVSAQQRSDDARADDLHRSFKALADHMNLLNQFQANLLSEVQTRGESMRHPLNTLCGSIQFQDVARQQLEQVSAALAMMSDHFVALSSAIINDDAPPSSSIALCLSTILESYVMEQQRAAHRGASAAAAPKIELF